MNVGKISNEDLKKYVFDNLHGRRSEVINGPNVGMDTSVIDFDGDLIVLSMDPITGTTKDIGKLSINISCNDVSCERAEPVGVLMTILLPPKATLEELEQIVRQADIECEKLNLEIIGGHTEVTNAVNQIVVVTTVVGKLKKEDIPKRDEIKSGDIVIVSKYIGIEGTSIIYNENKNELSKIFNNDEIIEIEEMGNVISVLEESKIAKKYNIKHLHDITEGGILGAVWETANALDKKIVIDLNLIPVKNTSKKIAKYYNIDIYRLISSGSMLMIIDKKDFENYRLDCLNKNILISKIGKVYNGDGSYLTEDNKEIEIEAPLGDELYKIV